MIRVISAAVLVALLLVCCMGCTATGSSSDPHSVVSYDTGISGDLVDPSVVDVDVADFESAQVERVVDGDTLKLRLADGSSESVRLVGIDAPESVAEDESRNCEEGVEASAYMKTLVESGDTVYLQSSVSERDRYGRLLRYVWLSEPQDATDPDAVASYMLNGIMVYQGYACSKWYQPDTAYNRLFDEFMDDAASNQRGVYGYWL